MPRILDRQWRPACCLAHPDACSAIMAGAGEAGGAVAEVTLLPACLLGTRGSRQDFLHQIFQIVPDDLYLGPLPVQVQGGRRVDR